MDRLTTARPCLVVDLHERSLFAALRMPRGQVERVLQSFAGKHSSYLPCTLAAADAPPQETPDSHAAWDNGLPALLERLGFLAADVDGPAQATVSLQHPIEALSSAPASAAHELSGSLNRVGLTLLESMTAPLFDSLSHLALAPRTVDVVLVVPAWTGHRAAVLLRWLFRSRGFRGAALVHREAAAALLSSSSGRPECTVLDVTHDEVHVHRVATEALEPGLQVRTLASRTVSGLGWGVLIRDLTTAIRAEGLGPAATTVATERALFGLIGGPYGPEIGTWPMTFAFVNRWLHQGAGAQLFAHSGQALRAAVDDLGVSGSPCIPIGLACMLGGFETLLLDAAGLTLDPSAARVPSLERCAMGIAQSRADASERRQRLMQFQVDAAFRLNNLRGDSSILIPPEQLTLKPGERHRVRRALSLQGTASWTSPLLLNLLWGCNPRPSRNVCVCALRLPPVSRGSNADDPIVLTVDLQQAAGCLHGTAMVSRGALVTSRRFKLTHTRGRDAFRVKAW